MPSEDSKPAVKRVKDEEEEEDEDDKRSLGSILKEKNSRRAPIGDNQGAKVKKEEPSNGGGNPSKEKEKPPRVGGSAAGARGAKVKKEVKDEDVDDDDDVPIVKKASAAKNDKAKVKKEVKGEDEDDDDDDVPISKKAPSAKKDKNKKKVKEEPKRKMVKQTVENGKKREKKVYDLPGQKRDPPEQRDPLRIFYETLYKQVPNSEMAQFWMMESGLLPKEEAKKVFEKKQKRSQAQRLGSPVKSVASVKRSSQTTATVKNNLPSSPLSLNKKTTNAKVLTKLVKNRKDEDRSFDNDSDDDFVLSSRVSKRQKAA
ncbi:transcriptional regulator ATRX homolog isoform X2 [Punica granatum]|uniref:Transcriptional regulator ATRX homolog isoform X2 n=1 Tax=Punica granatum TaxID=22663 RepID=A0A6P8E9G3_PUNGR|nr:transcriptional regulator ATRX homolog isoform X2 [Punica granatum]